ncbi:hypothetical protein L1987_30973 [Smallanthus sonchifolius]|uniref:Uncharacterized protein n=1 Tax=Smallanthus sonchifolius TaxID=185202 RepID=A0ACB9I4B9_9ASTR|nr:hypothetical protein L1987_30973 [Smallanthus sonchifolius]
MKKCLADENLHIPLDDVRIDETMHFVEKPVEIMDREVKQLKRSRIPIVKVRWESKRGPEFTWEREDQMKLKYPHLFTNIVSYHQSRNLSQAIQAKKLESSSEPKSSQSRKEFASPESRQVSELSGLAGIAAEVAGNRYRRRRNSLLSIAINSLLFEAPICEIDSRRVQHRIWT